MKTEKITIVKTSELAKMKLTPLAGMTGIVISWVNDCRTPGAWVCIDGKYLGEDTWFIPKASILTEQQVENKSKRELINMFRI